MKDKKRHPEKRAFGMSQADLDALKEAYSKAVKESYCKEINRKDIRSKSGK